MNKEQMDTILVKAVKKYDSGANNGLIAKVVKQSQYDRIAAKEINYHIIRDKLILMGTILEENLSKKVYIICINGGLVNYNSCIVAIYVGDDYIFIDAFSREGVINQRTAQKVIMQIKKSIIYC